MEEIRKMKGDAVALCSEIKSGFAHIKKVYPISYVHLLITPYIQCFALTSFCVGLKEYWTTRFTLLIPSSRRLNILLLLLHSLELA